MKLCLAHGHAYPSSETACPVCGWSPARIGGLLAYAPAMAENSSGFRPEYFPQLAALEAGNFWFRIRNELIRRAARAYFPKARDVLEVGCGTGFALAALAEELPGAQLWGSEVFVEGLRFAAERVPRAQLIQMDARAIPFQDEFDLIAAFDVLEHIDEDSQVLSQMFHATRPGGGVLLTVPQHMFLWSAQDEAACHVRRYQPGELETKLDVAGFKVIRTTSFVTLLFPLLVASRWLKKKKHAHYDPTTEFRIPRAMNAGFYAVLKLEAAMISAGMNFPFGGTRLIAAVKKELQ